MSAAHAGRYVSTWSRLTSRTFASLSEREFRWAYASWLGDMGGLNMQLVVRGYLVYVLTNSYAALGLVGMANAVSMLLTSPIGGVLSDRLPKRTVIALAQAVQTGMALTIALLLFTDQLVFVWLIAAAALQGTVMGLALPARQALLSELVEAPRMTNAVSLNIAASNTTMLVGPVVGGLLVSWFGFSWAYVSMTLLYATSTVAILRLAPRQPLTHERRAVGVSQHVARALEDVGAGVRYAIHDRLVFALLGLSFASALVSMPYLFLLPGYAADVLSGDSSDVGVLVACSALGSLVAAILLATLADRRRGPLLLGSLVLAGMAHLAFAQTTTYWIAAVFIAVMGCSSGLRQALTQSLLLVQTEPAYRGRIMSIFMLQWSTMQFGAFLVGIAAEFIGIRLAFAALGAAIVAIGVGSASVSAHVRSID